MNIDLRKQVPFISIILIVVTLAVFWQVTRYDFIVFDDNVYVTDNIHIQSGITLNGLCWAFKTTYAEFWHPLTWLSLMFDYQFHGLNAGGYHLTNIILHIMSSLLLFWLLNRMTGDIWKSAFAAAFFALHPLRVESVAWIAERKDVLSAFFWMLTLYLYVCYTEKPVIRRYVPVLFFFICGLMSKPMVVTLPVVMILLDYWPLRRFEKQSGNLISWQLKEKGLLFICSAIFSIITLHVQDSSLSVEHSLYSRIANAPVAFMGYVEKIFWPHNLAVFYPFPDQLDAWLVIGTTLLIIVISAAAVVMVKRWPYFFVGWLWYLVTILPVIGIIPVGDPMADRYVYLPSIGIAIILAWGIPCFIKTSQIKNKILFPAGIFSLAVLAFLSWNQTGFWENSVKLFNHTLEVTKNNPLAQNARAFAYAKIGQPKRAIEDYNEAIRLQPDYAIAYHNRGVNYANLGQYQLAVEDFNTAISLQPHDAASYYNRGIVFIKQGDVKQGCADARKACEWGDCTLLKDVKRKGICP